MKSFTLPKNKLVMTTALLAVLGFNVSFNSHKTGIASADFASTSADLVESKLITVDGVMPVKYVNNGESEVLAIVPKKMTEGRVCDNCGYETIPLTTKNKSDIDALNVQLLKALQKTKVATVDAREEVKAQDVEEKAEKKDHFAAIEKSCSRYKENSEALSCTSEKFIKVLRSKSSAEIETAEALDFFKAHIETAIRAEISDARRMANKIRRASVTPAQSDYLINSDDWTSTGSEGLQRAMDMREAALKAVRTILAGIPSKHEEIRKRLLTAETEIAKEEARELQQTFIMARDSKDPSQGVYLFKEGELRRVDLQNLMQGMLYHSDAGLAKAQQTKDINSELYTQYDSYIKGILQSLKDGMWQNPYSFMGAVSNNGTLPGINLSNRIANPGRRGTVATPALPNREGNSLAAPVNVDLSRRGRM